MALLVSHPFAFGMINRIENESQVRQRRLKDRFIATSILTMRISNWLYILAHIRPEVYLVNFERKQLLSLSV